VSTALDTLARLGFRVRLGPDGQVQVAPGSRLTDEVRGIARRHADEIRAALTRYRVWTVTLLDGTRLTAIRPTGAALAEVLEHERAVFGHHRVIDIQPSPASKVAG
jgi:hypothetical protein